MARRSLCDSSGSGGGGTSLASVAAILAAAAVWSGLPAAAVAGDSGMPELPGVWRPRGDTQLGSLDRFRLGLGIQYRVMYNASNLPGPAGTTISDTASYDFLRQRLRVNLSLSPGGVPAGGFLQAEFRGGFGGSSPNASDPRSGEPTLNPFNRLQARGIRYGYLWAEPLRGQVIEAGILPLSDELGDTLFSADWDFNVGGVALFGQAGPASYRAAYLRLIEGVAATDADEIADDGDFVVADVLVDLPQRRGVAPRLGAHLYYLHVADGLPLGATDEAWIAGSGAAGFGSTTCAAFVAVNAGTLGIGELDDRGRVVSGFRSGDDHLGWAARIAVTHRREPVELALQALYASGDRDGRVHDRFVTPAGLLGTEGYWAYTHLFTANGPSDVNDLALDLGNGGAGLVTVQGRLAAQVTGRLRLEGFAGWFQAARERNGSNVLGPEVGAMATLAVARGMTLDVGAAGAFPGGFFGPGADDLFEVFARWQLQY